MPHGTMCKRHRTAIELSFGDPAEELRTVDDDLWPSTWKRSSICSIRPEWFGRWRPFDARRRVHCIDAERELLVVHIPGAVPRDIDRPSDHGQFYCAE